MATFLSRTNQCNHIKQHKTNAATKQATGVQGLAKESQTTEFSGVSTHLELGHLVTLFLLALHLGRQPLRHVECLGGCPEGVGLLGSLLLLLPSFHDLELFLKLLGLLRVCLSVCNNKNLKCERLGFTRQIVKCCEIR